MKRAGNILKEDNSQYKAQSKFYTRIKKIRMFLAVLVCIFFTYTLNQSGIFAYFTDIKFFNYSFSIDAQYTVTFDSNGGTGTMTDQIISYNVSTPLKSNTYTKDGFVLDCWNTSADGSGTSYNDEESVLNLGNTTLYAQWTTSPKCTITFDYGDEIFVGNNYINTGISLFNLNSIDRDFEVTATISDFTYNPGQNQDRNTLICNQYEGGDPYQGFAMYYREGKIKVQGNSISTNESSHEWGKTSGTIIFKRTSNVLYYDNTYLIDYSNIHGQFTAPLTFGANIDNNGNPRRYATVTMSDMSIKLSYLNSEIPSITLPTPTRTGYFFDGWFTQETGGTKIINPTVELLANKTIYARWIEESPDHFTVVYYSNGGTGTMANQVIDYGVSTPLSTNTFTKIEAVFNGWNTSPNGTGTSYSDGQSVTDLGNIALYAQWREATHDVTFCYGDESFDGTYYVDSGLGLFSTENINRDFVISTYINNLVINVTPSDPKKDRNTFITNHYETKTPWQGFSFIYRKNNSGVYGIYAQGNCTTSGQAYLTWGQTTNGDVVFTRTNKIIYFNNQLLIDFSNYNTPFNQHLVFGANLDDAGNPRRPGYADLNDISLTLKYTNTEISNLTLPIPYKPGYTFDGWYTEETGGTKITTPTPALLADKTIYARWIVNSP